MSELHQEIDRRFREASIEIAFPQQDLHLRSLDDSIIRQVGTMGSQAVRRDPVQGEDGR
jgi:small-conductance mechanosensitive channel